MQTNQDLCKRFESLEEYISSGDSTKIKKLFCEVKCEALKIVNKQLETFRTVNQMGIIGLLFNKNFTQIIFF